MRKSPWIRPRTKEKRQKLDPAKQPARVTQMGVEEGLSVVEGETSVMAQDVGLVLNVAWFCKGEGLAQGRGGHAGGVCKKGSGMMDLCLTTKLGILGS